MEHIARTAFLVKLHLRICYNLREVVQSVVSERVLRNGGRVSLVSLGFSSTLNPRINFCVVLDIPLSDEYYPSISNQR